MKSISSILILAIIFFVVLGCSNSNTSNSNSSISNKIKANNTKSNTSKSNKNTPLSSIPEMTKAGSEICNDNIDVANSKVCIELLNYQGFPTKYIKNVIRGVEKSLYYYPLTESDLNDPGIGLVNYLGVVLYEVENSDFSKITSDICEFRLVTEFQSICEEEDGYLGLVTEAASDIYAGGHYHPMQKSDVGELIFLPYYDSDPIEFSHFEITISHEYFHMYQNAHINVSPTIRSLEEYNRYLNSFPEIGPKWFAEGTAEYASRIIANKEGWLDFNEHLYDAISEIYLLRDQESNEYINFMSISQIISESDYMERTKSYQENSDLYLISFLATLYAVHLSSHDAVTIDYWDDLKELGAKESFRKNVGMSFTDFYKKFNTFLKYNVNAQYETLKISPTRDLTTSKSSWPTGTPVPANPTAISVPYKPTPTPIRATPTPIRELSLVDMEYLLNEGNTHYNRGSFELALKKYDEIINSGTNNKSILARAYNEKALALSGLKSYFNAIEAFNQSIDLNPTDFTVHINLAIEYYLVDQWQDSVNSFEFGFAGLDANSILSNNLGPNQYKSISADAYYRLGNYQKSFDDYTSFIDFARLNSTSSINYDSSKVYLSNNSDLSANLLYSLAWRAYLNRYLYNYSQSDKDCADHRAMAEYLDMVADSFCNY